MIHSTLTGSSSAKTHSQRPLRIVSVDMGIRNLAYCVLSLPALPSSSLETPTTKPSVLAWNRLAVSKPQAEKKESFHPADYAVHAYELLTRTLLPYRPTHVLIERQRTRTMGGSAVQEWTMRVNMLESQLYAVLYTLAADGGWDGRVEGISPARVAATWLDQGEWAEGEAADVLKGRIKGAGARRKKEKVRIVGRWLESGEEVTMGNPVVESTREKFLAALKGQKRGLTQDQEAAPKRTIHRPGVKRKISKPPHEVDTTRDPEADEWESTSKLDDMADCLLQGVAWIRWEENRRRVRLRGVEALDHLLSSNTESPALIK
jgi:cruciform cutting endonuclease 1